MDLKPNATDANSVHALDFFFLFLISVAKSLAMLTSYFSQTDVGSCMAKKQTLRATAKMLPVIHERAAAFGGI